jgi:hypothetical protein
LLPAGWRSWREEAPWRAESGDGGDGRARLGYYSGLERARKARGRTARATARRRNMEIEVGRWKMLGSVASAHYSADSGSTRLATDLGEDL